MDIAMLTDNQKIDDLTIARLSAEVKKLVEEGDHYSKKNRWFEFTIGLAIFAAGIAFAKLFI
jgi:hypothetical protein